jgi:hypothetical protein
MVILLHLSADCSRLEVAVKVCPKAYPEERVGVVAMRNNVYTVLGEFSLFFFCFWCSSLEYSEINETNRNARDSNGDLVFSASHSVICNYDLDFVINFCNSRLDSLSYVFCYYLLISFSCVVFCILSYSFLFSFLEQQ